MLKLLIIFIFSISLYGSNLKIASYNVENFFDLTYDKSEYNEFIPNNNSLWNQKNFNVKLNNLIKVIDDIDADIIGLQEIENKNLMQFLQKKLPKYKYFSFIKYPDSAVGLGFLSKVEIKNSSSIDVKFTDKLFRPILETTFVYENVEFKIFNNHWPSKAAAENYRIKYAKTLQDRLLKLPKDYDYILLGDFNSNYNEFETFKKDLKLNLTSGVTGINHVLNTIIDDHFITYDDILKEEKKVHYNLWLDIKTSERFSTKFKNQNNTPDNIILSSSLFDNKNLTYIKKSFEVFKPNYLYENGEVKRWKMTQDRNIKIHKGEGFSDHLPIFAKFSINENITKNNPQVEENLSTISSLYKKEKLIEPIFLNDVIVIYKDDEKAIIKKENDRAIYIYQNAKDLKLGYSYNLQINQIYDFFGLKEVKDFFISKENKEIKNYKDLYLDASNIDIFDFKYENEVITNLAGIVKNGKLYINENKFIKLFAKDKNILPKDNEKITILNAQLGSYKGNMQIILHQLSDYKVEK